MIEYIGQPATGGDGESPSQAFDTLLGTIDPTQPAQAPDETPPVAAAAPEGSTQVPAAPAAPAIPETLPDNKQQQAFATLRISNRNMQQALQGVLQRMGVDPNLATTPESILEMLDNADVQDKAQQLNVPPELLSRMQSLEREAMQNQAERLARSATDGFEAIKTTYGLTSDELKAFAVQLQEDGLNPFEQEMDLKTEYIRRNLDAIIKKEREAAIQEALANQTKVNQYSTAPAKTQGKPTDPAAVNKINTMASFDGLLRSL